MATGAWKHIAVQRRGDDNVGFIDGVPGTLVLDTSRPANVGSLWFKFGSDENGNSDYIGRLAETRISYEAFYPEAGFADRRSIPAGMTD